MQVVIDTSSSTRQEFQLLIKLANDLPEPIYNPYKIKMIPSFLHDVEIRSIDYIGLNDLEAWEKAKEYLVNCFKAVVSYDNNLNLV